MAKTSSTIYREIVGTSHEVQYEIFHFFFRDFTYVCHGVQSVDLATTFYHTTKVIKYEQDLETLEVGTKLFSTILQYLLSKRKKVVIWKRVNDVYEINKQASPGNIMQVESLLTNEDYNPCIASLSLSVPNDDGNKAYDCIGVSVMNTAQSTLVLYDSIDIFNLTL